MAVVALYTDCDSKTKHMKCECNRHIITSFRRMMVNRLPLCSVPRPLNVGYIMLTKSTVFVKVNASFYRPKTDIWYGGYQKQSVFIFT